MLAYDVAAASQRGPSAFRMLSDEELSSVVGGWQYAWEAADAAAFDYGGDEVTNVGEGYPSGGTLVATDWGYDQEGTPGAWFAWLAIVEGIGICGYAQCPGDGGGKK